MTFDFEEIRKMLATSNAPQNIEISINVTVQDVIILHDACQALAWLEENSGIYAEWLGEIKQAKYHIWYKRTAEVYAKKVEKLKALWFGYLKTEN